LTIRSRTGAARGQQGAAAGERGPTGVTPGRGAGNPGARGGKPIADQKCSEVGSAAEGHRVDARRVGSNRVWRSPSVPSPVCRAAPRYPPFGAVSSPHLVLLGYRTRCGCRGGSCCGEAVEKPREINAVAVVAATEGSVTAHWVWLVLALKSGRWSNYAHHAVGEL
jgi:hypothetical protein